MNRKNFLKTLFGGAAVAAVAPEIVKAADRSYNHSFTYPKFPSGSVVNWNETEELISATEIKIDHMALNKHLKVEADRRTELMEELRKLMNENFSEHSKQFKSHDH